MDTIRLWSDKTTIPVSRMLGWLDLPASKYYQWIERYGQRNEHNATLPKSHWLTDAERRAIVDYYHEHPEEGYRRLTYLLLDANVVAASPSSVYRVLVEKGLIRTRTAVSKKGTGFEQLRKPHETILQRAHERHPGVTPRIISDNGLQFIARDFKEFVRQ